MFKTRQELQNKNQYHMASSVQTTESINVKECDRQLIPLAQIVQIMEKKYIHDIVGERGFDINVKNDRLLAGFLVTLNILHDLYNIDTLFEYSAPLLGPVPGIQP